MSDLGVLLQPLRARASRQAGRRRAPWLLRGLPGLAGCGLAGLLIAGLLEPRAVEPTASPEDPVWVDAGTPLYGLTAPGFSRVTRAEAVMRRATCPVLTVKHAPKNAAGCQITTSAHPHS